MKATKTFTIADNNVNRIWCHHNLSEGQYLFLNDEITIAYENDNQKPAYERKLERAMQESIAEFKEENKDKWLCYTGAEGVTWAWSNDYMFDTYEEAVSALALHEGVSEEEIREDYANWYYILPMDEVEDDCVEDYCRNIRR